jgi:hypothetical protein
MLWLDGAEVERFMGCSDHGRDEDDEGKQSGDVGLEEHGADDGGGCFVGGDVLGGGLVGEAQHNEEGDDKILHLINDINSQK